MKAAAGSRLDQALAGEHMQRIPHRRHAACQQLCQHRRVEANSRPKLMRHHPLLDRVIDSFGGIARVHCTRFGSSTNSAIIPSLSGLSPSTSPLSSSTLSPTPPHPPPPPLFPSLSFFFSF